MCFKKNTSDLEIIALWTGHQSPHEATASSSKDDDINEPPMEKAEVDKVFRDKEKECGHMKDKKVKPLQFDLIINYMRTNRSSMSIHSLNRPQTCECIECVPLVSLAAPPPPSSPASLIMTHNWADFRTCDPFPPAKAIRAFGRSLTTFPGENLDHGHEYRNNIGSIQVFLWSMARKCLASEFCGDPSDDFCIQRSEAWTFIMEHLEECPPLNLESRKFWMELVSFGKSPIIRCENLVKAFHNSCLLKFGRYEDVSYDYQLFLLELLEWDFAAVLSNFESSATEIVENPKTSSRTARTKIDLSSTDNLELIPLAFTLICALKKGDLVENALDQEHLYERLSGLFEKATDLCSKKLYARLIGLLFVHLFVNKRDMYFTAFSHADLPTSYREQMRKVRTQLADKEDDLKSAENINLFAGLLDVKWCADLILSFSDT
uniref:Uncharacterized protein n=1 Tax=Ditylenchus dipsaci TaxID=166011 RepID=A0A915CPE9_9BILA